MAATDASDMISASIVDAGGHGAPHAEAATPPATPPAADYLPGPSTNANHPTTGADPLPPGAGPAPTNELSQVTDRPSFIRHCPSSTNRDAYNKKSGRQLAPLLIDESGMGPRFHLLDNEVFSARIPGKLPSEADRKKFKSPKLRKGMLERAIYPQLGAVIQSVLKAAKCKKLRFLDTANHKAKDGNSGPTETFNDAGLYRATPRARDATDLDAKQRKKSRMSRAQLEERLLGARSWFWMDVPVEVKGEEKNSAFYFKSKPNKAWKKNMHPAAVSTPGDDSEGDGETHEDGAQQEGEVEEPEPEEGVEVEEGGSEGMEEEFVDEGHNDVSGGEDDDDDGEADGEGEGVVDDDEDDEDEDEEEEEDEEDENEDEEGEDEDEEGEDEEEDEEDMEEDAEVFGETEDEDVDVEGEEAPEDQENPTGIIRKPVPPFIKLSDNGEKALGQFVEYHLNLFKYQHRTFSYSIYVCYDMARLLYFDRAGAYVSKPFSWVKPTSLLHEFVWKFAKLANANKLGRMGHDTTAKMVSLSTRRRFVREAKDADLPPHIRAGLKKAAEGDCPLYKLTIKNAPPTPDEWFPDEPFPEPPPPPPSNSNNTPSSADSTEKSAKDKVSSPPLRRFIVGRPHFSADALVGRCTKGYMAFDVTNPRKWVPCFLKDSWRPCVPGRTRPEHLVYERLNRKGVKPTDGIATLICGGDVGGTRAQRTRVQDDLPEKNRPVRRVHYRLVIEDIGLPLNKFYNFADLSGVFAEALRAHYKVLKRAGILHRDISVGNIMIRVDGAKRMGFLIDWDLSRLESELGNGPVEPDRTGTWQFRSALSLRYPRKPYRRSDDIESFVHAYLYLVLRYHPVLLNSVKAQVISLFEEASLVGGVKVGGDAKFAMMKSGDVPFGIDSNVLLEMLLSDLVAGCAHAYSQLNFKAMDQYFGPDRTPRPLARNPSASNPDSDPPCPRPSDGFKHDRHSSDGEMSQQSDLEDLQRQKALRRNRLAQTHAALTDNLCKLGSFLRSPATLIDLFLTHSKDASGLDDKGYDQFMVRRHEDLIVVPEHMGSRSIATLSVTGSSPSAEGLPEGIPEYDQFGADPTPSVGTTPPSSSPNQGTKKRGRFQPSSDAEDFSSMNSEEERRRVKRVKGKGRAKGKARGTRS